MSVNSIFVDDNTSKIHSTCMIANGIKNKLLTVFCYRYNLDNLKNSDKRDARIVYLHISTHETMWPIKQILYIIISRLF